MIQTIRSGSNELMELNFEFHRKTNLILNIKRPARPILNNDSFVLIRSTLLELYLGESNAITK